jgi:histidine triad (HIT) family protein
VVSDENDCVFCRIVRGELPSAKVYEDGNYLAFRDINPAAPTHVLVVPKRHVPRLSACGEGDGDLLAGLLLTANKAAAADGLADYRLVVNDGPGAGQTVFHLHAHVLGGRELGERLL